ncbi:MAG TPA: S1 RNA-binding domain-containing protein, partial [Pirellulaceae bacterium]|nr:S1 RNA-binding domain-containing protein [Pirellulaceae bacterium]
MKSEMLINVSQPEECRIAIVEEGVLEELYIERASQESFVGNIYKGRIVNLEPSIQAAFVDFGVGRNGFLHISDVEPQYFRQGGFDPGESMGPGRMADIDVGDDDEINGEDEPGNNGGEGGEQGPPRQGDRGDRGGRGGRFRRA